jgi:hypothetical protein
MTLRAVVHDGLIVVNTHGAIADGTTVEILVPAEARSSKPTKRAARAGKTRVKGSTKSHVPGFGMWADRTDLGTSEDAVDRLRKQTRRRRLG